MYCFFHHEKRSQNIKTWWNQLPIYNISMQLSAVEPRSIAWKAVILTVGLQTLDALFKLSSIILMNIPYAQSKG